MREFEVFEIWSHWSGLSLGYWPSSLASEFAVVFGIMLLLSEEWVKVVSESSVESWLQFVVLRSGCVRREG